MPEGPEVKLICDQLNQSIGDSSIISLRIIGGRYARHGYPDNWQLLTDLLPIKINSINCKGKFIYFILSREQTNRNIYLTNTLGMSGSWKHEKTPHAHLEMVTDKATIYFTDPRNFGTLKVIESQSEIDAKLKSLGYDVLDENSSFNLEYMKNIVTQKPSMNITKFLMDQKYICGIGNYLKSEILYHSKISPHRTLGSFHEDEIDILVTNIIEIPRKSYLSHGSSLLTYTDMYGNKGGHQFSLSVYRQKKDKNGYNVIQENTADNRTTHWVREVQL